VQDETKAGATNPAAPVAADAGAPWFYRNRYMIFGMLYGLAFFAGYMATALANVPVVPAFRTFGNAALWYALGLVLVLGGYALRVWASSYLTSRVVHRGDTTATELRVSGPYRFTRNPLYLGNIMQALGVGLLTPWPVFATVAVIMIAYNVVLIAVEEPFLAREQGAPYERYLREVPRLIPIPGKAAPPGGQRASLADGLRGELTIGTLSVVGFVALSILAYTTR
jgi:protein-S-isoprenylcysteine O-methyltransferase Ste14